MLSGETFTMLARTKSNSMVEYLEEQLAAFRQLIGEKPQLVVVVFGKHSVRDGQVSK